MRSKVYAAAAVLLAGAFAAVAGITPIGDPMEGESWSQRFQEDSVGNFDFMAIQWVSGGQFESQYIYNFSSTGWSVAGTPTLANASRPNNVIWQQFDIKFAGLRSSPLVFDFFAWGDNLLSVDAARATWNGAGWTFAILTPRERGDYIVPAPGAVLLGAIGLGLVGWVKRRLS